MNTFLLVLLFSTLLAPPQSVWEILYTAKATSKYDPKTQDFVAKVKPSPVVRALVGRSVTIEGYKAVRGNLAGEKPIRVLCQYEESRWRCLFLEYTNYIQLECPEQPVLEEGRRYTFTGTFKLHRKAYRPFQLTNARCLDCD